MTIIAVCALFALAAIVLWNYRLKSDIHRMKRHEAYAKSFFDSARPLMSDDETPVEVLEMLEFVNANINSKRAARDFITFIGRAKAAEPSHGAIRTRVESIHRFFTRRPELKQSYYDALSYGLLSMSYSGGRFFGFIMRIWLSTDVGSDDAATKPRSENMISKFRNGTDFALAA